MPSRRPSSTESSILERDEYGDGIITDKTFSAPIASHASAATTAESIPPDNPSTARFETVLARVVANAEHERAANRFDVVAGQTTFVRNAAIEIDCAEELFERRRLQNDLSLRSRRRCWRRRR